MPYQGRFPNNQKNGRRFSPIRRRNRTPDRRKSRSPFRRRSRSPFRKSAAKIDRKPPGRKGSRSPNRRDARSPVNRKPLRSPKRRVSRSPVRQSLSPRRRLSRSPVKDKSVLSPPPRRHVSRSPVRKLQSPNRRLSSPIRNKDAGSRQWSRSRSRSRKRDDGFQRSPELSGDRYNRLKQEDSRKLRRSPSHSPRRSPRRSRSPHHSSRNIADRLAPISPGPKIIRDTSGLSKIEPLILRKRTLDERFRTLEDGHFRIDENITIGIQRNPYAPASTSVTVQKVFDPHLFHMIHSRDSGLIPIFDRPELKYFRFDDMPHYEDEPTFERRTIKVAPSTSNSKDSRYGHIHLSRRSPSPRRRSPSPRRRSQSPRRRSPSPRRRSPSPRHHTEMKLEMRTEPRYENIYQDSTHNDRHSKVITNPNDLRHNLSNRHPVDDARYRIDGKREERGENSRRSRERKTSRSYSPVRNQGRNNRNNQKDSRNKGNLKEDDDDLPDFSRRPDRSKYQPWVDNPTKIPKGISYFQSTGKAKIVKFIQGYIVGVTKKFKSYRDVDQFYFRLYHENMFIHGISFNHSLWSTFKTIDGSTCLGAIFRRAKLRPPRQHKPWNLVVDRFTKVETKLMPFPMHLETDEREVVKPRPGKMVDLYADEESYNSNNEDEEAEVEDASLDQVSDDEFTSIVDGKEVDAEGIPKDSSSDSLAAKSEAAPIKKELPGINPENPVLKGSFPLKSDFNMETEDKKNFKFQKKKRSYRKREASPTESKRSKRANRRL